MSHGNCGEWDSGRDRSSRPVRVGDELWMYYCGMPASYFAEPGRIDLNADGWNGPTNTAELRPWHVGVAKMRLDGWAYLQMQRDSETASFLTLPFDASGKKVSVNGKGLGGLKAELVDENGTVIKGFEKENSSFSSDDSVCAELSWNGMEALPEGNCRLRFHIDSLRTKIYSFDITD